MMSLPCVPGGSRPSSVMRIVFGLRCTLVCVAKMWVSSPPPIPQASAPSAPMVQLWLSPRSAAPPMAGDGHLKLRFFPPYRHLALFDRPLTAI
jgi:hypothetical protein